MYLEDYLWIQKTDSTYKEYEKKQWKPILSVKTVSGEIYYCLAKFKTPISDADKERLLAPLCLVNEEYRSGITSIPTKDLGYLWLDNKCFFLANDTVNEIKESLISNTLDINLMDAKSLEGMVQSADIKVRSYIGASIYLISSLVLALTFVGGFYIWLF
ncbi:hypothetical protein VIBRN418_15493 [Vibrio sp. N418]|uniref:hypothetical protein n=1 Tax=Vibrio sp. (strain N418) TaxID=701176 RepID=UPI00021BDF24|nr:hypothetical protein [Vibrio sp. N418]EGU34488.1 hypothetical protein VIBRN418_15493 [Vibrio sp. N418]